ncbi:MAG: FeoA family protein [Oscillospiraceae bacterium]
MESSFGLHSLRPGETALVKCLNSSGALRRRLLDMGMVEGTRVECLGVSRGETPRPFWCGEVCWPSGTETAETLS